jgi:adenosine deaminase CECR1
MSHEFYQIMVGSPTISIHSWKQLALWSLEYSCLNEPQKEQGKRYFLDSWDEFCAQVVDDYSHLFDTDGQLNKDMAKREYELMKEEAEQKDLAEKIAAADASK